MQYSVGYTMLNIHVPIPNSQGIFLKYVSCSYNQ